MLPDVLSDFRLVAGRKLDFRVDADMALFLEELVGLKPTAPFHVPKADHKVLMCAVLLGSARSLCQVGEREHTAGLVGLRAIRSACPRVGDGKGPCGSVGGWPRVGGFADSRTSEGVVPRELEGGEGGGMPVS